MSYTNFTITYICVFFPHKKLSKKIFARYFSQFDASRWRKKGLETSRDKNARHEPYWGGERRACYVTPDLSYDQEGERKEERRQ